MKKVEAVIIAALAIIYVLLGFYYSEGFPCFTWINGVYCTGKTVQEVNEELAGRNTYGGVSITDKNGAKLFVSAADVDLKFDYTQSLSNAIGTGNPLTWGMSIFKNLIVTYRPDITLDKDKLGAIISEWEIFADRDSLEVSIIKTDDGYVLKNGFLDYPDLENIINAAYNALTGELESVSLSDYPTCYLDLTPDDGGQRLINLYERVDELQSCGIIFTAFDEEIPVEKGDASDFILCMDDYEKAAAEKYTRTSAQTGEGIFIINGEEVLLPDGEELVDNYGFVTDSDGNLILSEKEMYEFMQGLSQKYDSSYFMDRYRNHISDDIYINYSIRGDGSLIDISYEFQALAKAYVDNDFGRERKRKMKLSDNIQTYSANEDVGDTYIEVDMDKQELYYYVDGDLNMEFPVVTGGINRGRGTLTGIFPVYNKRYHTYLRGADYISYVNYWIGVYKGIGIHDATWRSEFGDEIYKTDGSHGCVNCPIDDMEKLWEVVEEGTPVVLYY